MATRTVSPSKFRKTGSGTVAKPKAGGFTHVLAVETVPDTGLDVEVHASEAECAALAETCGVVAVHDFEADFHVRKLGPARFKVKGNLHSRVTQICVVSLEPFETRVDTEIDVDFAPSGQATTIKITPGSGPAATFHGGEDPPDPIIDGKIDLGALAEEFLILNLDIYPRKPGVFFDATNIHGDSSEKDSPFAVLGLVRKSAL